MDGGGIGANKWTDVEGFRLCLEVSIARRIGSGDEGRQESRMISSFFGFSSWVGTGAI